ncbi:hypothetical protein D3C85_527440 [compost metagenome]
MEIDIREDYDTDVTCIRFCDTEFGGYSVAHMLARRASLDQVKIMDKGEFVILTSEEHARNLIVALNKAIDLGWFVK